MVALTTVYSVDDPAVAGGGSFGVKVPDDTYKAVIVKSHMVSAIRSEDPQDLMLTVVITEGKHNGVEFEVRLGIMNPSPIKSDKPEWTWQRAAYSNIAQISKALGMSTTPSNTDTLHGKPLLIETASKAGKPKSDGNGHWPDTSYIKTYRALPATGAIKQTTDPNMAKTPGVPAADAKPPWEQ